MAQATLADTIREARKRAALSQEELAQRAGVSWRTVWNLENGYNHPRGETLRGLAEALNLDLAELTLIPGETA